MIVFALAFVVFCTSARYFFLVTAETTEAEEMISEVGLSADVQGGQTLFDNRCSFCHYADRTNSKMGPGLKGVLKGEKLPYSGRPATSENVKQQIRNPISTMPSFASLSEEDIAALLAYLKTL
jgi:cytochrome c2